MKKILLFSLIGIACISNCQAQDSSKFYFTTGVGVVKVNPALHHVLKPAVAFNSGFEFNLHKGWYTQATIDFNTLKYDQHVKDDQSDLLFQNTNSSLLLLALTGGKNFRLNSKWFTSAYAGGGFLSIGEPRITVVNNVATQEVKRNNTAFGRAGWRIAHRTRFRFLETVYLDASWWGTTLNVQGYRLTGFTFYLGTRMGMSK